MFTIIEPTAYFRWNVANPDAPVLEQRLVHRHYVDARAVHETESWAPVPKFKPETSDTA